MRLADELAAVGRHPLLVLTIGALLGLMLGSLAHGHDAADWINQGGYKNSAGALCCGARDCSELAAGDVSVTAAGYYVRSAGETVPFAEAQPSPDGHYWRCAWGEPRKCFFAPPTSM